MSARSSAAVSNPIEEYGVIGDMRTLALVHCSGSIDWLCWPRFDTPSMFGALLDPDGGSWSIRPETPTGATNGPWRRPRTTQTYLSGTNVLLTRIHTDDGVVEIEDLMTTTMPQRLVRRVRCERGAVPLRVTVRPRPDYGRGSGALTVDGRHAQIEWDGGALALLAYGNAIDELHEPIVWSEGDAALDVRVTLSAGQRIGFVLCDADDVPAVDGAEIDGANVDALAEATIDWWREWNERSTYRGRWRELVERSALTLKLLSHEPSGALIAAGTTSIPEAIGGTRNWDYRYVWIRDAAFTVYALLRLGHVAEATSFTAWLVERLDGCDEREPPLMPLYDVDGVHDISEAELDHWRGYAGSRPVRIGNAASDQVQLDIYGELIDALYLTDRAGDGLPIDTWRHVCRLVDYVIDHWRDDDQGMWEVRSSGERHTSSVLMCWVAVERAIRMARRRGRPADVDRWRKECDKIHDELVSDGWNDELDAWTRTFDGSDVDASILLAPLVKFVAGDDPRWLSTLRTVERNLARGPLVDRYDTDTVDDGVDGSEGSFLICSFWFVEALTRAGRIDDARRMFDRLVTYSTPLGQFSEEVGPDGRLIGNFPQAFTHLALISAAIRLNDALDERSNDG